MSSKTRKETTKVEHSEGFLALAKERPDEALAFMYIAAFGFQLNTAIRIVDKAIRAKDTKVVYLMLTSAVQIRLNVTFVGDGFADVKTKYPDLIIKGKREVTDAFNFGALHICGHLLAMCSDEDIFEMALEKAGNCINGSSKEFPDNEAGRINSEIRDGWSEKATDAAEAFASGVQDDAALSAYLSGVAKALPEVATAFETLLFAAQTTKV